MDVYTAAVMREVFSKYVEPTKKEWRKQIERVSDISYEDCRHLVRDEPSFVPYFGQELELGSLNIGIADRQSVIQRRVVSRVFEPFLGHSHGSRHKQTLRMAERLSAWLRVGAGLTSAVCGSP